MTKCSKSTTNLLLHDFSFSSVSQMDWQSYIIWTLRHSFGSTLSILLCHNWTAKITCIVR